MTGAWPWYLGDAGAPRGCRDSLGPTGASFGGGNEGKRETDRLGGKIFPCSSQERDAHLPILSRALPHPLSRSLFIGG